MGKILSFFKGGIVKKIAIGLAVILAGTGLFFGIKAIVDHTKDDLKTIKPAFSVGNLGNDGKYVKDEGALYTEKAFKCDGVQVKPDFDSTVSYQLYFYDDLDNFIESSEVMTGVYSGGNHDSYARMVITPTDDDDGKISLTERVKYPEQLTVKVSKKQETEYFDVFGVHLRTESFIDRLVFEKGLIIKDDLGNYVLIKEKPVGDGYFDRRCLTSKQLLKVHGGLTLNINYDLNDMTGKIEVVEFYKDKGSGRLVQLPIDPSSTYSTSVQLNKKTEYIFIRGIVTTSEATSGIELTSDILSSFGKYLYLTK